MTYFYAMSDTGRKRNSIAFLVAVLLVLKNMTNTCSNVQDVGFLIDYHTHGVYEFAGLEPRIGLLEWSSPLEWTTGLVELPM